MLCGYQSILFALFTKMFAISEGLLPPDPRVERAYRFLTLEIGLIAGGVAMLAGLVLLIVAVIKWRATDFGKLDYASTMRSSCPGVTLTALGFQTMLSSFFVGVLGMRRL